jgi:hypothetical protein
LPNTQSLKKIVHHAFHFLPLYAYIIPPNPDPRTKQKKENQVGDMMVDEILLHTL